MDKLEAMRVFCKVVEHGSFAAAADRLDQSTSAVSRWVAQLEGHLQARLLNRTTRRISLTESGRAYFERATQLLLELDEVESAVSEQAVQAKGTLKITTSAGLAMRHLAPAMAACRAIHPELQFSVFVSGRTVDLVEEGFDLALRVGASSGPSNNVARRIGRTTLLYVASPDYLASAPPLNAPDDLHQHPCITYEHDSDQHVWQFYQADGSKQAVRIGGGPHTDNGDLAVELAAQGLGIGTGPCFIVRRYLENGRVQRVLPHYKTDVLNIYAVYPTRKHLSAKVRLFVNFFEEWLADNGLGLAQSDPQTGCPTPA